MKKHIKRLKEDAVSNNGLRARKGNYWSDQPDFRLPNEYKERVKAAVTRYAEDTADYAYYRVFLSEIKRFVHEKVYPFVASKWDAFIRGEVKTVPQTVEREGKIVKENEVPTEKRIAGDTKVICFEQYEKRA